jgi:hypothetical protein
VSDLKHNGRPRIKRRALLAVRKELAYRAWRQGQTISMASARIETVKVCENGGDAVVREYRLHTKKPNASRNLRYDLLSFVVA